MTDEQFNAIQSALRDIKTDAVFQRVYIQQLHALLDDCLIEVELIHKCLNRNWKKGRPGKETPDEMERVL